MFDDIGEDTDVKRIDTTVVLINVEEQVGKILQKEAAIPIRTVTMDTDEAIKIDKKGRPLYRPLMVISQVINCYYSIS